MRSTKEICSMVPVIPVIVSDDLDAAQPLAEALVDSGLKVLEVTLRTPNALKIAELMSEIPDAIVGVGTVRNKEDMEKAIKSNLDFCVSPGMTDQLKDIALSSGFPFLPGAATVTESMQLADAGFDVQKFFPAEAAGGVAMLKSFASPFPDINFCPTGGINPQNYQSYLELPNVLCIGGSWLTPAELVSAGGWDEIKSLAREVVDV